MGYSYFKKQNQVMEQAVSQLQAYLDGDHNARIECDEEGELYRLFHTVNSMAAVLNAHADNELREKEFLKNAISDISHQLKTPLAALNIYNGLLQDGDMELSAVKEFADLSEQDIGAKLAQDYKTGCRGHCVGKDHRECGGYDAGY